MKIFPFFHNGIGYCIMVHRRPCPAAKISATIEQANRSSWKILHQSDGLFLNRYGAPGTCITSSPNQTPFGPFPVPTPLRLSPHAARSRVRPQGPDPQRMTRRHPSDSETPSCPCRRRAVRTNTPAPAPEAAPVPQSRALLHIATLPHLTAVVAGVEVS